jgi:hypothetical protein
MAGCFQIGIFNFTGSRCAKVTYNNNSIHTPIEAGRSQARKMHARRRWLKNLKGHGKQAEIVDG